jgi:putative tryptophan/tyrosine transport system substrate-binding protein
MKVNRRQLVQGAGAVGLALLAGCGRLPGQTSAPAAKVHRIAYLEANKPPSAAMDARFSAFRQGMRDLGYVEGQNLLIEERYAHGVDQLAEPAADLVRLQPAVILVPAGTVARAVQAATTTLPIVSAGIGTGAPDLVASGLAASYARPGGNVTGLSTPSLVGKQLQLLQDAVPPLSRVAVLFNDLNPDFWREPFEAAARTLGVQLLFVGAGGPADLERAFETAIREHADGLFLPLVGWINANQTRIAELALQRRLPSMWAQADAVGRGGLMAYAPNPADMFRRAAYYVDRILQGTSPADLPVEEPREFELVLNLKTAQALGLTIPHHILIQATEVIQ